MRLPAFAKINLCLHVMGKRPDGYHELRTIFQAISLHDTLEPLNLSWFVSHRIRFITPMMRHCLGPENLVFRAFDAITREIGFRGSVYAHLEKKIPVARGLGGGSSDAAATLVGMLRLTNGKYR